MAKSSAGILLYRRAGQTFELLLVHPGGPFWAKKDLGAWSIPKGEFESDEQPLVAAKREFQEEIGAPPPTGEYTWLGDFKQPSGKVIYAFALESDFDLEHFKSDSFEMEWPPRSGKKQEFPENDKAAWTPLAVAMQKVVKGQMSIVEALAAQLGATVDDADVEPQTSLF